MRPAVCSISTLHRDCAVHLKKGPEWTHFMLKKCFNFGYRFLCFINQTQMQPFLHVIYYNYTEVGVQSMRHEATIMQRMTCQVFMSKSTFPPEGTGRFSPQKVRYGLHFHCQKVGVTRTEPHSSGSTPPLGYRDPERVSDTAGKFELHTLSVDWSTGSALPCDRGLITNKQYSGQRQKLHLLKKMSCKSVPSFLDILQCFSLFIVRVLLFPWIYQQTTLCRAAMRSRCLRSCRGYRRPA